MTKAPAPGAPMIAAQDPLAAEPGRWQATLGRLEGARLPFGPDAFAEILVLGTGETWPLAPLLAEWIGRRHPARLHVATPGEVLLDRDLRLRQGARRLAVALSAAGEMPEALAALGRAGVLRLVLGGGDGAADHAVPLPDGAACTLLAGQALFGTAADRAALDLLPGAGRALLAAAAALPALPARPGALLCLGAGPGLALAEAAARQIGASAWARALPALDPAPQFLAAAALVALLPPPDRGRGLELARRIRAGGAPLAVIGPGAAAYATEADLLLPLPAALTESQGALPALLALRLLARHLAAAAQPPRGVARV